MSKDIIEFEKKYKKLDDDCEQLIIKLVRDALSLKKNNKVFRCTLAMGTFFFEDFPDNKGKTRVLHEKEEQIAPELYSFVYEWNRIFKITGMGIIISRDEIIKKW